jgi:hypothetical protein
MTALKKKGSIALPAIFVLTAGWVIPATATEGDIFEKGVKYWTTTYQGHPSRCGTPIDINIGSGYDDNGIPLYAPENGTIESALAYSAPYGWGNNIYYISNSGEKLFLAHLQHPGKLGSVKAGDKIGEIGNTGCKWKVPPGYDPCSPHLHIERCNGQLQLSGTKIKAGNTYTSKGPVAGGPGGPEPVDPSDPPSSGKLPDFITNKVIMANSNKTGERYTWKVNETPYVHAWLDNIGKADWQGSADNIKVPFYLSKGTKKDSSSEWVRVGREQIKKKNIQVKDKPKDEKVAFNIPQWAAAGYIYPGRTYNFVVCADRPKDQDNGDGDVKEIHKSNNCSTPAVFYVDYGPARNVDVMASNLALAGGKSSLQAGEAYGFQADISNIGTEYPWNGCRTNYEIKGPGTGDVWQKVADEGSTVSQLGPNSTHVEVIDESRGLKAPAVGGDYVFRACADYEQAIPETDESNNCTAELPVTVTVPPPPAVTPRIVITNPTHTDEWRSSSTEHDIRWERYDFPTPGNVKVEYSLDGGATWLLIDDSTTNDEKKHWEDMCDFHTVDTHHAYIRITSLEYPGVVAVSDEFSIDHAAECE